MDERTADKIITATERVRRMAALALTALAVFLIVLTLGELKSIRFIGSGVAATNTITVSGTGEVFAVPDTAQFSVTVMESAADVKSAQDSATKKSNDIISYLKGAGVAAKDIQTTDYSVNPQYEYRSGACPAGVYCPPGRQVLSGYQVSQTLSVKVRDTTKAGDLLAGVGSRGASNVSGLDFTIADQNALEAQARDKAIADAKGKAATLAKSLGVSIVRIVGFAENNGGQPIYYAKAAGLSSADSAPPAPQIPAGQNKITSNVSLTYEIQ
jgi:uncharacterized protein YggE